MTNTDDAWDKEDIDEAKLREQLKSLAYPMVDEDINFIEGISTKAQSFISCTIGEKRGIYTSFFIFAM